MTYIKGYILDHWGKGPPSAAETAVLDLEVEILKQQERETQRKGKESTIISISAKVKSQERLLELTLHGLCPPDINKTKGTLVYKLLSFYLSVHLSVPLTVLYQSVHLSVCPSVSQKQPTKTWKNQLKPPNLAKLFG